MDDFEKYLPKPDFEAVEPRFRSLPTSVLLPGLEQRLSRWLSEVKPITERLRKTESHLEELELLSDCLKALPDDELDMELASGKWSRKFPPFLAMGRASDVDVLDAAYGNIIGRAYPIKKAGSDEEVSDKRVLVVGITDGDVLGELERRFHSRGMRFVRVPPTIQGSNSVALRQVDGMIEARKRTRDRLLSELNELNRRSRVAGDVWLLRRHRWINDVLADSLIGRRFVWLGGWASAARYDELIENLQRKDVPFLISRASASEHGIPPVQLHNPRWIRRFETFVKGFGIPAANEVDPSPVLAVMTPVMFGYMFGDVGHGAVLMLIGLLARKRLPVLELLIVGGFSSIIFGFLFGSIFCDESLLTAIWIRPMDDPLLMLLLPIGFGWLVIMSSMLLAGVQAHWQGNAGHWWAFGAPIIVLYCAAAAMMISTQAAVLLAVISLLWFFSAAGIMGYVSEGLIGILRKSMNRSLEFIEGVLQLAINTLSFARLGAFALAHTGLSAAVITLSAMPDNLFVKGVIFIAGNLIVIALEGLVVSIQTTRLVMFEFFRRFYAGGGRPFQPLQLPNHSRSVKEA
jgi:V/A-type H+-transporting ATPase subunit I